MAIYQRKDSKTRRWFYKFSINGVTYKQAIPTARTRRQAEEAERKARQDVYDGTYGILPEIAFRKFVTEHYYPYIEQHRRNAEHLKYYCEFLCTFFGNYTLRQISPLLIEKFKLQHLKTKTIKGEQRKASSVNAMLIILSGILTRALKEGRLKTNPCSKVKRLPTEETNPRTLSHEEEKLLLECAERETNYIKPIIQLALWLGWRESEIIDLRTSDIDFARNLVFVPHAKWAKDPRKTKGVPMSDPVRELLFELVRLAENEFIFMSPQTKKPYSATRIRQVFRKACDEAGIVGMKFHGLRHTFGSRLADINIGAEKIRRAMGHSSINTTMIYIHTSEESLRNVMEQAASVSVKNAESSTKIVPLNRRMAS